MVMEITTIPSAIESLYSPMYGTFCNAPASASDNVAPPTAPASTPTNVMPICTVDKKTLGSSSKYSAVAADLSPSSDG